MVIKLDQRTASGQGQLLSLQFRETLARLRHDDLRKASR